MARTTEAAVQSILEEQSTATPITPFIDTASQLVTDCCGAAGYTDAKLELIERWLAAHYYAVMLPRANRQSGVGLSIDQFDSKVDMGLKVTWYGQQVLILDTAGGLAAANTNATAVKARLEMKWLGKDCCPVRVVPH